ncbi:uncharacterized protein HaLaN_09161 [Haematococcus lacustris]|uniref:Uncharacterized protein n=1 Tax=Haematococcus lacustris TaxID=44745 RepID=A0A699YVS8_HAELA|nr:uncharacterized protein HaLaN_09161 [Haematococcus lacustris]
MSIRICREQHRGLCPLEVPFGGALWKCPLETRSITHHNLHSINSLQRLSKSPKEAGSHPKAASIHGSPPSRAAVHAALGHTTSVPTADSRCSLVPLQQLIANSPQVQMQLRAAAGPAALHLATASARVASPAPFGAGSPARLNSTTAAGAGAEAWLAASHARHPAAMTAGVVLSRPLAPATTKARALLPVRMSMHLPSTATPQQLLPAVRTSMAAGATEQQALPPAAAASPPDAGPGPPALSSAGNEYQRRPAAQQGQGRQQQGVPQAGYSPPTEAALRQLPLGDRPSCYRPVSSEAATNARWWKQASHSHASVMSYPHTAVTDRDSCSPSELAAWEARMAQLERTLHEEKQKRHECPLEVRESMTSPPGYKSVTTPSTTPSSGNDTQHHT